MNILKLIRGLKIFTLDEIALIAEVEEAEIRSILDDFLRDGKLNFDGEFYKYVEHNRVQNFFELKKKPVLQKENRISFEDFAIGYLNSKNYTPLTFKSYKYQIFSNLIPYFGKTLLQNITRQNILDFILQKQSTLSQKTLNNCVSLLGSILKEAYYRGFIFENPYLGIENTKQNPQNNIRILSEDELGIIFASKSEELKLFANLILATGMKKQEILSLAADNIDPKGGIIKIEHNHFDGKIIPSNFRREISAGEHLQSLLMWLGANLKASPATINKRLKKEFAKLGFARVKMDDLRNNFCVEFLKTGTFSDLAKQLGMRTTDGLIKKYGDFL